jgi:FlaA1/EpsC-like NDP-sugar epimerase
MLEMGEPVTISDLAEQLIRLSGFEPHKDVQIVFTGLRPGEKLHEELTSFVEHSVSTQVEKIRIVQRDEADAEGIELGIHRLAVALDRRTHEGALHEIQSLVPEYRRHPVTDRRITIPSGDDIPSVAHEIGQGRHRAMRPVLSPVQDTIGA